MQDWRDAGFSLHWWDVALLKATEQKRDSLRQTTQLQADHLQRLCSMLDSIHDDTMSPDRLLSICRQSIEHGDAGQLGEELYRLVTTTFFLTHWVTVPQYALAQLRDVAAMERSLLLQRTCG